MNNEQNPVLVQMQAEIKRLHDELALLRGGEYVAESGTTQALQGYAVQDHAPAANEYLKWIAGNSRWEPTALEGFIGVRLRDSANEATATGTWEYLDFDTESYDTDTMHEGVTNPSRITIKTAGVYAFGAHTRWQSNATGKRLMMVSVNRTTVVGWDESDGNSTAETTLKIATEREFAINDYIEVRVQQTSGGNLNVLTQSDYSPLFWARKTGDPT